MLKKPTGRRIWSTLGPLLPVIVAVILLQVLFGSPLLTPKTEMTYTEFKAALARPDRSRPPRSASTRSRANWPPTKPLTLPKSLTLPRPLMHPRVSSLSRP